MIAAPGPAAYTQAKRFVSQGMRPEDAAMRTGFGLEALNRLLERDRATDLAAWNALGETQRGRAP